MRAIYSAQKDASACAAANAASKLPAGLNFSGGYLYGTPTKKGNGSVTVTIDGTDRDGKAITFRDMYRVDYLTQLAVDFLKQPQTKPFDCG